MNDPLAVILSGAAGVGIGVVFFGGLWWTVRRGMASGRPAVWFFGSVVLRMSIALAGFYFVGSGDWKRLAACLAGFVIARFAVIRLTRAPAEDMEEQRDGS